MPNSPLYPRKSKAGRKPCPWTELANHLKKKSKEICKINECKCDNHYCESYAYIRGDAVLLDVCAPDFFQGSSKPYAAIPLPWHGCGRELKHEVENDCEILEM
jgi:hypothetical protein